MVVKIDKAWMVEQIKRLADAMGVHIGGFDLDTILDTEAAIVWSKNLEDCGLGWFVREGEVYATRA